MVCVLMFFKEEEFEYQMVGIWVPDGYKTIKSTGEEYFVP